MCQECKISFQTHNLHKGFIWSKFAGPNTTNTPKVNKRVGNLKLFKCENCYDTIRGLRIETFYCTLLTPEIAADDWLCTTSLKSFVSSSALVSVQTPLCFAIEKVTRLWCGFIIFNFSENSFYEDLTKPLILFVLKTTFLTENLKKNFRLNIKHNLTQNEIVNMEIFVLTVAVLASSWIVYTPCSIFVVQTWRIADINTSSNVWVTSINVMEDTIIFDALNITWHNVSIVTSASCFKAASLRRVGSAAWINA